MDTQAILTKLGLTDAEVDVYLALCGGARRAQDIVRISQRSRPTVYYALSSLENRGLISKSGRDAVSFQLESPNKLKLMLQAQRGELEGLQSHLEALIPTLDKSEGKESPLVSFYEGTQAAKILISEALYCKSKHIDTIVPAENFFHELGKDFVREHVSLRNRYKVTTRSLWEREVEAETISQYYTGLSEIRILPEVMRDRFKTTVFLYDETVLYISSLKSSYCLQIRSAEHFAMMQALFDGIWHSAKPHTQAK